MRGSAAVQGLKSFASKLVHPQLPLAPKESQKLLVALTTAFQNELDQAHPRQAEESDALPAAPRSSSTTGAMATKRISSATLADRHLAAVLTNPLLASSTAPQKPVAGADRSRAALKKDPAREAAEIKRARAALDADPTLDAVSLLEEYEKEGTATLRIAEFCLQAHQRKIAALPLKNRKDFMVNSSAGKRSLLWLLRSESYKDPVFLESGPHSFRENVLVLLAREGEEEFLWKCVELDKPPFGPTPKAYEQIWKGSIFRAIVTAKLLEDDYTSANAALDAYFRAAEMRQPALLGPASKKLAANGAYMRLLEAFSKYPNLSENTDPARFDKFMHTPASLYTGDHIKYDIRGRLQHVQLSLIHPRKPTPLPALSLLREAFQSPDLRHPARDMLENPANEKLKKMYFGFLSRTASQLNRLRRHEDAEWVEKLTRWLYPRDLRNPGEPRGPSPEPPSPRDSAEREEEPRDGSVLSFT